MASVQRMVAAKTNVDSADVKHTRQVRSEMQSDTQARAQLPAARLEQAIDQAERLAVVAAKMQQGMGGSQDGFGVAEQGASWTEPAAALGEHSLWTPRDAKAGRSMANGPSDSSSLLSELGEQSTRGGAIAAQCGRDLGNGGTGAASVVGTLGGNGARAFGTGPTGNPAKQTPPSSRGLIDPRLADGDESCADAALRGASDYANQEPRTGANGVCYQLGAAAAAVGKEMESGRDPYAVYADFGRQMAEAKMSDEAAGSDEGGMSGEDGSCKPGQPNPNKTRPADDGAPGASDDSEIVQAIRAGTPSESEPRKVGADSLMQPVDSESELDSLRGIDEATSKTVMDERAAPYSMPAEDDAAADIPLPGVDRDVPGSSIQPPPIDPPETVGGNDQS